MSESQTHLDQNLLLPVILVKTLNTSSLSCFIYIMEYYTSKDEISESTRHSEGAQ